MIASEREDQSGRADRRIKICSDTQENTRDGDNAKGESHRQAKKMGVVNTHQLRRFLIVGHRTEGTTQAGTIQKQLQPADDGDGDDEHQAWQGADRQAARQIDVQSFQLSCVQTPAVSTEDLQQGILQKDRQAHAHTRPRR
jgi:hypothetical protein